MPRLSYLSGQGLFSSPEGRQVVDLAEPESGPGQKGYYVSTVTYADTHQALRVVLSAVW
jgi:hypothetical protein